MNSFDDVIIIVAAFNEETKISETLTDLKKYFRHIIVVDDGSSDLTAEKAKKSNVLVLRHPINLGQGAAIQTAITKALEYRTAEYFVTFDADGQHSVSSAVEMVQVAKSKKIDLVLGSRFLMDTYHGMPKKKKLILKLGIFFTRLDTGLKVTDAHNGLRVMSRNFAESLAIKKFGMAHASEILVHAKQTQASWIESPAEIFYTDYSIRKGQSILNAINIFTEMLHK